MSLRTGSRTVAVAALLLLASASLGGAQSRSGGSGLPADTCTPLPDATRAIAEGVPDEAVPVPEEHYLSTNERRHDLWFPHIRDLGGAYVGVGSDQTFTLAAIQNASLVYVVDFDQQIPWLHRVYDVLVRASETPEALVERFSEQRIDETVELVTEALDGHPDLDGVVRMLRGNRRMLHSYLSRVKSRRWDGAGVSWLSEPALYARVRRLFFGGRIIARAGDVTGAQTLRAVGEATRRLGVPVRVLYLSNAEAFFGYTDDFVANVRSLPMDEGSVVLRTYRHPRAVYPDRDTWAFMVQPAPDFLSRIERGYRRARQIVVDAVRRPGRDRQAARVVDERTPRRDLR